ncbi:hypothetical protein O6H91_Y332200 [Diphasiastrum complanatum]|nr:hypothetical protein O6H91_Y332200 [Diphasiastrum complanatum]
MGRKLYLEPNNTYSEPDFWKRREHVSSSNRSPAMMNLSVLQNALAPLAEESGIHFFMGISKRRRKKAFQELFGEKLVIKDLLDLFWKLLFCQCLGVLTWKALLPKV